MQPKYYAFILAFLAANLLQMPFAQAQKVADVRGFVIDKTSGQPIPYATVQISTTPIIGGVTDMAGFFNINDVPFGKYTLSATVVGFDSLNTELAINTKIINQTFYLSPSSVQLQGVEIRGSKEAKRGDVLVSVAQVTPTQIKALASTGGEADIAQYLQVLPGVVFTGDQGGQLYIRGGSPVQNKILLDGMTLYNPFHSIGFFSVFETEALRNVNVYTGGFGAEYGGRTSAVVDIQTREGNKKRVSGLLGASPFQAKILIEGPIIPLNEDGLSVSYLFTAKHSYLPESSKVLYAYNEQLKGLPYGYTDGYGKLSLSTKNGSSVNVFGFTYNDKVNYRNIANLNWASTGGGLNFKLIPENAKTIFGGRIAASNYIISLLEADGLPRSSEVGGFETGFNFTNYGKNSESSYGFELSGFRTAFKFVSRSGLSLDQTDNNTDLAMFYKYKIKFANDKIILEPSLRLQYYASLSEPSLEPRLGAKWNATKKLRFKFAGGYYTQNLISAVSERDIVNLFVGFLSSPDNIYLPNSTSNRASSLLQKSWHAIGGVEIDAAPNFTVNVEPYYKYYPQLIGLNRNKATVADPDFQSETGQAYGIDFSFKYERKYFNVTANYSYAFVNRFDGIQTYATGFDRRHNINVFGSYSFGNAHSWEASARWNMGSGFPFTLTQGFHEDVNFQQGLLSDPYASNGTLGILYADERNGGRLPYYHRLDLSVKKAIKFSKYTGLDVVASLTNAYNRPNIFYFDRVTYQRVNQLPLLPSLAMTFHF